MTAQSAGGICGVEDGRRLKAEAVPVAAEMEGDRQLDGGGGGGDPPEDRPPSPRDGNSPSSGGGSSSHDDEAWSPSPFASPGQRIMRWCAEDWKKILCPQRSSCPLILINVVSFVSVMASYIVIFEASTESVRSHHHKTAIFPVYVTNAAALAFACKWKGSAAFPNFAGFFAGFIYGAARNDSDLLGIKLIYMGLVSVVEMLEVQVGAGILLRKLCPRNGRRRRGVGTPMPTIDNVEQAVLFLVIVFGVSLSFETLTVIVNCTTGLVGWSSFARLWSTRWLAVLAAYITIAPALIHILAYGPPQHSRLARPKKVAETLLLVVLTVVILGLVTFSLPFTTVIRPLPYLLYPLLIFSVYRFNRMGWTLVVAAISFFGSWGSLHYNSSALYYTSGSSKRASPMLLLQLELFMCVIGIVALSLAGAVREKTQLTKDLHGLNQRLEDAVSKRTQELIRANKELQISQAHAEKANLAKSDFLANMSHEIRTPIHGILGLTAILLQTQLSADQLENLTSVKDCADMLLHIINSILDLAKIEAGRLEVESVPFSIRKVVSGTLRMLQVRAKDRGLQLLWTVDADVPQSIAGDPGKIQQCLLNLVGNALKFTHNGSVRVHISLRSGFESSFSQVLSVRKEPIKNSPKKSPKKSPSFPARLRSWASWPSAEIQATIEQDTVTSSLLDMFDRSADAGRQNTDVKDAAQIEYVLIEVSDTGIGISNECVRDMFNPFTQADASTSRLYGGTGLGLSIVQRFVELLGGKIWVESEIGKGSMFSFVVPFRRVKGDCDGTVVGSPQASSAAVQPHPITGERPPRPQQKTGLQQSTLGKGRRARSLNTLMKNLKFSSSSGNDAEPLLQMTIVNGSKDFHSRLLPADWGVDIDRVDGSSADDNVGGVKTTASSHRAENLTSSSTAQFPEVPQSSNESANLSANSTSLKGPQSQAAVNESSLGPGKQHGLRPHSRIDLTSLSKSIGGYASSRSTPASEGTRNSAHDGRDLELGILDNRLVREGSGEEGSKSTTDLSRESSLVRAQPPLNDNRPDAPGNLSPEEQKRPQVRIPRRMEKLHVLVVEDNIINQKIARAQLEKHGHTATIVGDGLQALDVVRAKHDVFDVVLMDIQMPLMDGLQATQKIREEESERGWSRIPILGLTAHAISGYQETCLSHGMDAYLGKPFTISQLLKIMGTVL